MGNITHKKIASWIFAIVVIGLYIFTLSPLFPTDNGSIPSLSTSSSTFTRTCFNDVLVTKVTDGDTIKAFINGEEQTIRVIGIDTPEYTSKKECYGKNASERAVELLKDKSVTICHDVVKPSLKDKYGRFLYHITVGGRSYSEIMVSEGLAEVNGYMEEFENESKLKTLESHAKSNGTGLWGACK